MDGFISVERFQSLTDPDKLLSLSFWRDEQAVVRWRCRAAHRAAQSAGRKGIFRNAARASAETFAGQRGSIRGVRAWQEGAILSALDAVKRLHRRVLAR